MRDSCLNVPLKMEEIESLISSLDYIEYEFELDEMDIALREKLLNYYQKCNQQ